MEISTFLNIMATFGFLIFPRMYYVRYERIHGHLPESIKMIGTGRVHVKTTTAKATLPSSGINQHAPDEIADSGKHQQDLDDIAEADEKLEVAEA